MLSAFRTAPRAGLLVLPLVLAALGCSDGLGPDAAATNGVAAVEEGVGPATAHVPRPMTIRGTVALVSPVIPPPTPCFQKIGSELAGLATHMGRFTGIGSTCILTDLTTATPDPDPPFTPAGPPPYLTAEFTNPSWVLTAANGDELWLRADDAVAVISGVDGSLHAEGTHEIVGGTGRFAGATGRLHTVALNDDGVGPDDFHSEGWIVY